MKRESSSTHVLELVLIHKRHGVNQHPWQAAAKVDDLVHHERHDAGGECIILDVEVPRSPEALEDVEVNVQLGHLVQNTEIVC